MIVLHFWYLLLAGYRLGSIPSALIASRLVLSKDIRQLGDRNMGARNTFHAVGWLPAAFVAGVDIGKSALTIGLAQPLAAPDAIALTAGACAVLGHDFPLFAEFRGGQGMATILGVFGMLFPAPTLLSVAALGIFLALTRNWDLSWTADFILMVTVIWAEGQPVPRPIYLFLLLPTIAICRFMQNWQSRPIAV